MGCSRAGLKVAFRLLRHEEGKKSFVSCPAPLWVSSQCLCSEKMPVVTQFTPTVPRPLVSPWVGWMQNPRQDAPLSPPQHPGVGGSNTTGSWGQPLKQGQKRSV